MKRTNFRIGYVSCKGQCGKEVPAWITPLTCRYCAKSRKCVQCGGLNKQSMSNGMCSNCYDIEYPTRVCSCGQRFIAHKSDVDSNCKDCNAKNREKAFVNRLLPIDPDYVVKVKIRGTKLSHSGYCSDPRSKTKKDVCRKMFFPAPVSFVDSEDHMNDSLKSMIYLYDLKSCSCACHLGVTEYYGATWKLVRNTPHMHLSDWIMFYN